MSNREERFEIDVNASRDEVWRLLTTAQGLTSWFGTRAAIDFEIGGERVVGWGDKAEIVGRIAEIEPKTRLRIVYQTGDEETGAEEWLLTSDGTTTRLTLINSMPDEGIEDWEGFYGDIRRGWRLFLASLRHGLEDAATPTREVNFSYIPAPGDRHHIWDQLETVITGSPLTSELEPALLDPPHSRMLVSRERTLLLDMEGSGVDQVVYAQASMHSGAGSWPSDVIELIVEALRV